VARPIAANIANRRDIHIGNVIKDQPTIGAMRTQLASPYFYYPEFKDYSVAIVREAYKKASTQVIADKRTYKWTASDSKNEKFAAALNDGELPSELKDADVVDIRTYVILHALWRKMKQIDESEVDVLSVIFKKPAYQPSCYPKELFYSTFSPELTPIVQANVLEGDALPD
jgi:hypothetical protein